tara:strand:- start:165 stop:512 length:348 start_codon:yes stop_codon:yes gene_type:complete
MSLISDSKYKMKCIELLNNIVRRPRVFYKELYELKHIMWGHYYAFHQLEHIELNDSFNTCFNDWLCKKYKISGSSGWSYSIKQLASNKNTDPEIIFADNVHMFIVEWKDNKISES